MMGPGNGAVTISSDDSLPEDIASREQCESDVDDLFLYRMIPFFFHLFSFELEVLARYP
jgi:hypothetical protein